MEVSDYGQIVRDVAALKEKKKPEEPTHCKMCSSLSSCVGISREAEVDSCLLTMQSSLLTC